MSIKSQQLVFCRACGEEFLTTFTEYAGEVCSSICFTELEWRQILSNFGKDYYPKE